MGAPSTTITRDVEPEGKGAEAALGASTREGAASRPPRLVPRLLASFALRRARGAARRKQWPMAQRHYLALIRYDPDRAGAHVQLGHTYLQQGALHDALASYRRAFLLTPRNPDISMQIGHVLKRLGRTDSAFASYLAAWRACPGLSAAADELRGLRPWIDAAWLQAAKHGNPPVDRSLYATMRATQLFLEEPERLEPAQRLHFRFLAGSFGPKT